MKTKAYRRLALILSLALLLLLAAGCGKTQPPPATPVPTAAPTASPEPTQTPPPAEEEEIVYVPTYQVYPSSMAPGLTNNPVEREDGVWFISMTEVDGEIHCPLMHGGKDAENPVTVLDFGPDCAPIAGMCFLEEGKVWLGLWQMKESEEPEEQTWTFALREVSLDSGETLREIPFPEENGSLFGFFDLPEGSLGVCSADGGKMRLFRLEADGTFTELPFPQDEEKPSQVTFLGSAGSGLIEGWCMAYDREGLFAFVPETGERRELTRWEEWGIRSGTLTPLGLRDGAVRLLDYDYGEYVTLTPTPRKEIPVRQELTMACLTVDTETAKAVRDFNRRSGEWYITVRDYSGGQPFTRDVQDRAITAMNLDIVNGNMPDLLAIREGLPFKSWAEKGFLRDLGPWLAEEGVELLPQLRRAGTVDDQLLMVCASFTVRTAVGNRDVIGDPGGWTVAEASALAAASPDCAGVFPGSMTRDKYLELLDFYLEGYLDWDTGKASFDSPEFRDVLAFAASLPTGESGEIPTEAEVMQGFALADAAAAEIMQGRALIDAVTVTSVRDWQLWDLTYMGKLVCPGLPAADGVGSLLELRSPMAVSAVSAHPEGAYAFLKSLLDEETQTAYTDRFPSLKAAFENHLAEAMREPTAEEGYRNIIIFSVTVRMEESIVRFWNGPEGERIPRNVVQWYDANSALVREEKLYAMSEEQRDALLALLDSALRSTSYDQTIAGIVHEEAAAYFAGQRSAEEVSQRIQRRAELYLAEQG